jgi:hypothetical protein
MTRRINAERRASLLSFAAAGTTRSRVGGCIMKKLIVCCWVGLGVALISGSAFAAQIARIIVVQAPDLGAYLHEVDALRGEFKKAGLAVTVRVWRARFAGPEAGTVVVSIGMADLMTLAKLDDLQKSNAEIAATMGRIGKLRKIVSDSLYDELSP